MMGLLSLTLFGGFHVQVDGEPVTAFESNKVRALLAYLAVEAQQGVRPHQRSVVAGLLWPDYPEEMARTNLRHILRQLRQTLPDGDSSTPLLLTSQQTIQLNPACAYTLDIARFSELLAACEQCRQRALDRCPTCLARYTEAATLYRGDFLAGLSLYDSEPFDEWASVRREQWHHQALEIFFRLAAYHESIDDDAQARHYAGRQLELEPWREEAHRQLMRVLAYTGQRSAALAQYAQCRKILADELGVEPEAETVALYEQIRAGKLDKKTEGRKTEARSQKAEIEGNGAEAAKSQNAQDWSEAPAAFYFYGRQAETEQLKRWLLSERCQLIVVLGMGGMGKTTLVTYVARTLATEFEFVFWRSLLNAPPLADLLQSCLQFLARQQLTQVPDTVPEQLSLLLTYLSQRRCLLVLDNAESILTPDQPGQYRLGYEAYGQLIERVAQQPHQSCLVITSRERPWGVARLEEDLPAVRTLLLDGLGGEAGQAILEQRGISGDAADTATLIERYSGNPLALKLVARTIQDLFDGDMATFLADETPVFDDIRTVLNEQFARLSPLEREILIWLAIEREVTALNTIVENLVKPPPRRVLIEALRALQRRSLLEKSAGGFLLQNVVIEYLTDYLIKQVCQEIEFPVQPVTDLLLNRHALFKAQAKEYVRQSQLRQIVQPIVSQLRSKLRGQLFVAQLEQLRVAVQTLAGGCATDAPGYLGGNLLNLLLYLDSDLTEHDFSHLCLWQSYLRGKLLPRLNLTGADLTGAAFTYSFGNVQSLQFQTDGELLVIGTTGEMACVWQAQDGSLLYAMPIQDSTYSFIYLHPDGHTAALGGPNHTIIIVDMATTQVLYTLIGHVSAIWRVCFNPTGKWIATGDGSGQIYLWNAANGERLTHWQGHTAPVTGLAFALAGDLLASAAVDGTVALWRLPGGQRLRTFQAHQEEVAALRFVLGDTVLATGSHDQTVCLWNWTSGALLHRLRGHTGPIRLMGVDADGQTIVTGGSDHCIIVWDAVHGQIRHSLPDRSGALWHLACRHDGQQVAALDANETLGVWDVNTGQRIEVYPIYHNGVQSIAFSPDGKLLASGGGDGTVYLWDVSSPTNAFLGLRLQGHAQRVASVAFSSDGITLASGDRGGELRLWTLRNGASRVLANDQQGIMALAFSPDGQTLASAGADGSLHLWHVQSRQQGQRLRGHTNVVSACAFSPDGRWLVSCGVDRTVRLWDAISGKLLHTLHGHTNVVAHVTFCPDGRRVISSGYDETICLWDASDGQLLSQWAVPNMAYISLDIDPTGALLAAGSRDHVVHLRALATGQFLGETNGHSRSVEAVRFSPCAVDGTQLLASASLDETIKLWAVKRSNAATELGLDAITCLATLRAPGPYAGMKIGGVTGISKAQQTALKILGAVG